MPTPNPALLPLPALFDVTTVAETPPEGRIERVALDALELAPNARRDISREGIERLAGDADAHRPAGALHRPPT